jgi:hypothetical protein
MDHYISREKTIEAIKTDLSQFVYDEYGNMTALGVRLIHLIGNITGAVEPFGNLIDRDEMVKDIECQAERDGRTSSDVITKGVLEVFLDYIRNFPSTRPVNETIEHDKGDLVSRKEFLKRIEPYNTDDKVDKALYTFAYYKMMSCSSVEPGRKPGKWLKRTDKTKELYGWYQCSQCGAIIGEPVNYCSECGSYNGGTE